MIIFFFARVSREKSSNDLANVLRTIRPFVLWVDAISVKCEIMENVLYLHATLFHYLFTYDFFFY